MEIAIKSKSFGDQIILVDDEDYEKIKNMSLSLFKNNNTVKDVFYVRTSFMNGKRFLLHRLLTDCPKGMVIDHINHNTLDNRKSNLRICTDTENHKNSDKYTSNKKSKYKGVFYKKNTNSFVGIIGVNYKNIHLGTFKTEKEAAIAYNNAALKYCGKFANLNIIEETK